MKTNYFERHTCYKHLNEDTKEMAQTTFLRLQKNKALGINDAETSGTYKHRRTNKETGNRGAAFQSSAECLQWGLAKLFSFCLFG